MSIDPRTIVLDPTVRTFVEHRAGGHPPEAARTAAGQRRPVEIDDIVLPGGPTGTIPARILRPVGASDDLPVVVYVHGGGWISGDADRYDRLLRDLVSGSGAAVLFPCYSRTPDARYPVAVEECYAVTLWAGEQGSAHGLDGSRLAIAGDSEGGNLAAVTAILAKERGGPELCCQVLFYPVTAADFDTASYRQFAEGYWLRRDSMRTFWDQYASAPDRTQPTASPLRASLTQLDGLPPALIVTAEADVVRDEGEAYAARLCEAGVDVVAVRYQGTIHDFVLLDALAGTGAARAAIAQAGAALRRALS